MESNDFNALLIKDELKSKGLDNTPENIARIAEEFNIGYTPRKGGVAGSMNPEPARRAPLPPLGNNEKTVPVNYGQPVIGKRYGALPSLDNPKEKEPLIDLTKGPGLPYLDRKNLYRLYMDQQGYRNPYMSVAEEERTKLHNEQRQEQEAIALADKNTMGAFGQLTENDNKAQTLFGNINAASKELADYKAQNAAKLSDPMVQATVKSTEARIADMQQEYQNRKALGDQMAKTLLNSNQGRYGYINDYVNARDIGRQQAMQPKAEEPAPVSDIIEYTPEQTGINKYVGGHKSFNPITSDTALENILASLKIPLTQTNREYLKQRLGQQIEDNYEAERKRLGLLGTGLDVKEKEESSKEKNAERTGNSAKDAEKLRQGETLLKTGTLSQKKAWLNNLKESGTASGTLVDLLKDAAGWNEENYNNAMTVELEGLRAKAKASESGKAKNRGDF
jgi:hypothetical protein